MKMLLTNRKNALRESEECSAGSDTLQRMNYDILY
jgi:hypothetical protein